MSNKTYKTIESPSGSGELRKAGAHLAKVFYHLNVRQEIGANGTLTPPADGPMALEITGEVTVSQDEPMQARVSKEMNSGDLLTLYLADGRQLEVYASKGDTYSDSYRISQRGLTGFVSK
jgi:hypothetical protein